MSADNIGVVLKDGEVWKLYSTSASADEQPLQQIEKFQLKPWAEGTYDEVMAVAGNEYFEYGVEIYDEVEHEVTVENVIIPSESGMVTLKLWNSGKVTWK